MKRLLFTILVLGSVLHAEDESSAWPTSAEAQAKLDSLLSSADRIEFFRIFNAGDLLVPVLTVSEDREIVEVKESLRVSVEERTEIVDGRVERVHCSVACGCYGQFLMKAFCRGEQVVQITLHHGEMIGCRAVHPNSMMKVDPKAHARLFDRLVSRLSPGDQCRQIWEMKKGEPGATDNPDDAQHLREDH